MSWLTNHEIVRIVQCMGNQATRDAFLGVFALNKLPQRLEQRPAFLIVNTQTDDLPGRHWLCLMVFDDGYGEVFNSAGLPPPSDIARWMNGMTLEWMYNQETYQAPGTATCGAYCVYVILNRLQFSSLAQTLQPFTTSPNVNERLIMYYYGIIKQAL